jgi:RND family efflux transporter MFP subunit
MRRRIVGMLAGWSALTLAVLWAAAAEDTPPAVAVCQPRRQEIAAYDFPARVGPGETVAVRAPVSGTVKKRHVKPGDAVKKGQLLFELNAEGLQDDLKRADKEVAHDQKLLKKKEAALAKARKNKKTKREELAKLTAERDLAEVTLKLSQAARKRTQAELERARVVAPVAGRIGRAPAAAGDAVEGGPSAATLLCTVVGVDPVRVTFEVDERTLLELRKLARAGKGKGRKPAAVPVRLALPGEKGFPHKGTIEFFGDRVDPKTRRARLDALFPTRGGALARAALAPEGGKEGKKEGKKESKKEEGPRVRLPLGKPRMAFLVPGYAVASDDEGRHSVLVVDGKNIPRPRRVKLGGQVGRLLAVEEGLKEGEWVVLGSERLKAAGADKTLSPEDFVKDLKELGVKPGKPVAPVKVAAPAPFPDKKNK